MLKSAFQKDDTLLEDVRHRYNGGEGFGLWWLGQSGFLLKWKGHQLLFDPYLSDSLTKKYSTTDKPHTRITERVVDPGKLTGVSVVTSSHNHTDHLDADSLQPLKRANPELTLILPEANMEFARERLGDGAPEMKGLDHRLSSSVGVFKFTGIAAAHNELDRDEEGRCRYLGYIVQFGSWTLYHSGDTLWHEELVPSLLPFRPQLMLLPINGNRPERRVAGNLNGTEAAALARACGSHTVIPCHYDLFGFNTADPRRFAEACSELSQNFVILQNGERFDSDFTR